MRQKPRGLREDSFGIVQIKFEKNGEEMTRDKVSCKHDARSSRSRLATEAEAGHGARTENKDDEVFRDLGEFISQLEARNTSQVKEGHLEELFVASGGRPGLAQTVVELATLAPWPVDLSAISFADYVATLAPSPSLDLSEEDVRIAMVLSHLSSFTKQTAFLAMTSVHPPAPESNSLRDSEGVLMRLQMARVVMNSPEGGDRQRLCVPVLLAAKLRLDSAGHHDFDDIIVSLVGVLVEHLENSQTTDPDAISDALILAHRAGLWPMLIRLQEAFGLSMFLTAPQAACAAFAGLPASAVHLEPGLGLPSMLAEELVENLPEEVTFGAMRAALAQATAAGKLRRYFPVMSDQDLDAASAAVGGRIDYSAVVHRIAALATAGRHREAVALGLDWPIGAGVRRARLVVRFLTAVSLFQLAEMHRALSILHEIEAAVSRLHVDGDFLLPAVMAWTALAAAYGGDHETTDKYLAELEASTYFPVILEEMVCPPMRVVAAVRALDRLDLDRARVEFEALSLSPENGSLWEFLPVIGRTLAILSAVSESQLLFVNDDVEKQRGTTEVSVAGADLLSSSRSLVFIGLGQLKWAEFELGRMSPNSGKRIVLSARIELISGRYENAIALVDTWFYHQLLTPVSRAELAAIKAAALLRAGSEADASAEFVTAAGLCAWVGSLLPLAMLPQEDRELLLGLTASASVWAEVFAEFGGHFRNHGDLLSRLRNIGSISVREATLPQLSSAEAQLLDLLAQGLSIGQLSAELHQVRGTVKNRLSALYRKFDVASKDEVMLRARSLGFIPPS